MDQSRHWQRGFVQQWLDRFVDHPRIDERLVALHVDDNISFHVYCRLRQTVRPAGAVRRSHYRVSAESVDGFADSVVIGRDPHIVDHAGFGCLLEDTLDHHLSQNRYQRLARQSHRSVPGRDHSDDFHDNLHR